MAKDFTESLVGLEIPDCDVAVIAAKSQYFRTHFFDN